MAKKPSDPRGGHARIYHELIDSNAWRAMGYPSQALYVVLRRKLLGTNNGNINAVLSELKHHGWRSSATLAKALRELTTMGFIAITRQGGIAYGRQVCSLYRFTDVEVFDFPKLGIQRGAPTNEWKRFQTLAEAHAALKIAHASTQRTKVKNKSGLQKMKRTDSENEALSRFNASDSEEEAAALLQKMKQRASRKTAANPRVH